MSEIKVKRTAEFSDEQCPKCGSSLLTNGSLYWCSFIGGREIKACDYGLFDDVDFDLLNQDREAKRRLTD